MTNRIAAGAAAVLTAVLATWTSAAYAGAPQTFDEKVNVVFAQVTKPFVDFIFAPLPGTAFPWIVLWLVTGAVVFTLYFGFVQFRFFGHAISLVKGDYAKSEHLGEVSHFQALATALSGTVGLGNIAGVAVAVAVGGPGATFWMILAGLLGMATKFCECTLGVKYRKENPDGTVSGGPMYYIERGFKVLGLPGGKILSVAFAILCIFGALGGGNMFQANQAHAQLVVIAGDFPGWITGAVLALLTFVVISGGMKTIATVTDKLVPFMALLYMAGGVSVLVVNYEMIVPAIAQIFEGAFTGMGVAGGVIGAIIQGFRRAAFSNEAGVGSAPIAHSAVRTDEPITEGFVSLLEPFIDTVVICTMTALVIVVSGMLVTDPATGQFLLDGDRIATVGNVTGVALTSAAFGTVASWFPYVLTVAVLLFAFSTIISWSYYGLKAFTYLFGEGRLQQYIFQAAFCFFIVIGSASSLGAVIDFSDAALFAMAIINIFSLYFLMSLVKKEMAHYSARLKAGEIRKNKP
jgi:alanine or glycine:cation symporter, AGCS family